MIRGLPISQEQLRYLVAGGYNTAFGYGLFAALQLAFGDHVHYLAILSFSHAASVLSAFIVYRRFVFRVEGRFILDGLRFSLVYLVVFLVNVATLPILVEGAGLSVLLAQALVVGGTVIASYFAHRRFTFYRPPQALAKATGPSGSR